jgi:hypothetical protein
MNPRRIGKMNPKRWRLIMLLPNRIPLSLVPPIYSEGV